MVIARVRHAIERAGGGIAHAEMRLGDGVIMLDAGPRNPEAWGTAFDLDGFLWGFSNYKPLALSSPSSASV